jgi:(p)ppGpp synthase/HD superfamily hydrolase
MEFLSRKFDEALRYAADAHRFQKRKSARPVGGEPAENGTPYIGHLISVSGIVLDAGGTEEEAIAALLHDVVEDQGGMPRARDVAAIFGERVTDIVIACSDSVNADPRVKEPWRERKIRYIEHLRKSDDLSAYLVSAADKLHNARCTVRDLSIASNAEEVWSKFRGGREGTLWYYSSLADAYTDGPPDTRRDPIAAELRKAIAEMESF